MEKLRPISKVRLQPQKERSTEKPLVGKQLGGLSLPTLPPAIHSRPLRGLRAQKPSVFRILDFDIENRPLSYLGMDFTTADITAIAWSWVGEKKVECWALGEVTTEIMLDQFLNVYNEADMVTGHYIRKHDLPHLNGSLMEHGMSVLSPKLTSDTKLDLLKRQGISASQENLSSMLGLPEPKHHMSTTEWRAANRLTKDGIKLAKTRCCADIVQHKALRKILVERGMLGPPRVWSP